MTTPSSIAKRAIALRRELAAQWLTGAQIGALLGTRTNDVAQLACSLRRDGKLLGVWVAAERSYRYPPWQVDSTGLLTTMQPILTLLRAHGGVVDQGRRTSGWNEVEWFMTPHVDLDGATPIERIADQPDAVLRAARSEFLEDANAVW